MLRMTGIVEGRRNRWRPRVPPMVPERARPTSPPEAVRRRCFLPGRAGTRPSRRPPRPSPPPPPARPATADPPPENATETTSDVATAGSFERRRRSHAWSIGSRWAPPRARRDDGTSLARGLMRVVPPPFDPAIRGDRRPQGPGGVMESGFDRADRHADDGGDVGQWQAGVVVQDEDRTMLRRQAQRTPGRACRDPRR